MITRKANRFLSHPWVLACLPLALFLSLAAVCCRSTVDDAFISFRYARNLAEGHGLVFNLGERVEGFSNPLWVFILSLISALRGNIVVASKVIGLACAAVTLVLLARLCRTALSLSRLATFAILCYAATNISLVYYAISGLETALYMAALVLMIDLLAEKREIAAGVACAVLALTRPEGIIYVAPLALGCALGGCRGRRLLAVLAIPIGAIGAYTAFRLWYYGALVPNSFHAKIGVFPSSIAQTFSRFDVFKRYTLKASTIEWPLLLLALAGAAATLKRRAAPMLASVAVCAFFVWYSKGDWMGFWRFYTPVVPFLAALVVVALELARSKLRRFRVAKVLAVALFVPFLMSSGRAILSAQALRRGEHFNPAMHSRVHIEIAKFLAERTSGSDVIVSNEIGAIGFYTRCTVVDMLGLTDPIVSSLLHRGDLEPYGDYILSKRPAFVILNNRQTPADTGFHPVHAAVYRRMMATGEYELAREFPLNEYRSALLYARKRPLARPGPVY